MLPLPYLVNKYNNTRYNLTLVDYNTYFFKSLLISIRIKIITYVPNNEITRQVYRRVYK